MTANGILIAFLILSSFRGLVQKSALLLLHQFNSPMNCEPPNYEITDNTRGSSGTSRDILAAQQRAFGLAANPFNNFSPLHLLTWAEHLCDSQGRISQAVHFRKPVKIHWVSLLKTHSQAEERETERDIPCHHQAHLYWGRQKGWLCLSRDVWWWSLIHTKTFLCFGDWCPAQKSRQSLLCLCNPNFSTFLLYFGLCFILQAGNAPSGML